MCFDIWNCLVKDHERDGRRDGGTDGRSSDGSLLTIRSTGLSTREWADWLYWIESYQI